MFGVGLWLCLCSTLKFQHWHTFSPTRCFALTAPPPFLLLFWLQAILSYWLIFPLFPYRIGIIIEPKITGTERSLSPIIRIRHFYLTRHLQYNTPSLKYAIELIIEFNDRYRTHAAKNHNNQIKWIRTIRKLSDSRQGKYRDIGKYTYLLCSCLFRRRLRHSKYLLLFFSSCLIWTFWGIFCLRTRFIVYFVCLSATMNDQDVYFRSSDK